MSKLTDITFNNLNAYSEFKDELLQRIAKCEAVSNTSQHKLEDKLNELPTVEKRMSKNSVSLRDGQQTSLDDKLQAIIDENEKLKKKIQEVDIRHEYVGKDLLKKLNAIESKQSQIENQNLQSEFMA